MIFLMNIILGVEGLFQAVPTLALSADDMQTNLFSGANIILVALGSIFFMLIGFGFGAKILRAVGDFINRFTF